MAFAGDAANFILGGVPGDIHDLFIRDVEPEDLGRASLAMAGLSETVGSVRRTLKDSVATLEGRWEGDGAAAFQADVWQPLSNGLYVLEHESHLASQQLAQLARDAYDAYLSKVSALEQEIHTQLNLAVVTGELAPLAGKAIGVVLGDLAGRLAGDAVSTAVKGIVSSIGDLIQKVLDAFAELFSKLRLSVTNSTKAGLGGIRRFAGALLNDTAIPDKALKVLDHIDRTGTTLPKYKGGGVFENDGRNGGQVLSRVDGSGRPISYREWDVDPKQTGIPRNLDRLVTGNDGSAWYTSNHYMTFVRIR
jgi:guanyl-specific ribonuclease Sa/uncharacterized protein YukE